MTVVAVVSDTHSRRLPEACLERLRAADLVLHAGDLSSAGDLADLEALGPPVHAVHGNVDSADLRARLPERRVVTVEGVRIGMVHDAGRAADRLARLRAAFPDCDAVVFGHSHIPLHEAADGLQIFNPGSPTDRRRQPVHTMGLARVSGSEVTFEHVEL
jgi:putative phosphoesterase